MRFMIIVKSTPAFEAETGPQVPDEKLYTAMADYHAQLAQAGALLDGSGLMPSSRGWRIHYKNDGRGGDQRSIVDGPFAESKELIAGYTLIQARSREEAMEWSRRFPNPVGEGQPAVIEVRQLYEMDDFPPGETTQRFKEMGMG